MDDDPEFIKVIINLTRGSNPTLVKKIVKLKKEIVDMGSVITNPMSNDLINFKDNTDIKNKPKTVKKIIDLTNDHNDLRFIKEIIDLTQREKRKKKKKKTKK